MPAVTQRRREVLRAERHARLPVRIVVRGAQDLAGIQCVQPDAPVAAQPTRGKRQTGEGIVDVGDVFEVVKGDLHAGEVRQSGRVIIDGRGIVHRCDVRLRHPDGPGADADLQELVAGGGHLGLGPAQPRRQCQSSRHGQHA